MSYRVNVRALCEFAARSGDLDLRYNAAPSALEGMAGHQQLAAGRGDSYQSELRLEARYGALQVRGRADGYDAQARRLEEIKTYRGSLNTMPGSVRGLHWAQAMVYGHMLCQESGLAGLEIALVYFDIDTRRTTVLTRHHDAADLARHFNTLCARFLDWAEQQAQHRALRNQALLDLSFPHAALRPAQRQLAEACYRTVRDGNCLGIQAPTGLGKTLGVLFPALKAMPGQELDALYLLAAKVSGRQVALQALNQLCAASYTRPAALRVVELTAQEQACVHPGRACHADSCPLARGFYDRLPAARSAALAQGQLDRAALATVAQAHEICPYHLAHELLRWCDVVVADYHHYFDPSATLYHLVRSQPLRVAVLADEAHNLVERARAMYSATLDRQALEQARRLLPAPRRQRRVPPPADTTHTAQACLALGADTASPSSVSPKGVAQALQALARNWDRLAQDQAQDYAVLDPPPPALVQALLRAAMALGEHMTSVSDADPELLQFYFDLLNLHRLLEHHDGSHSVLDLARTGSAAHDSRLSLRNIVPGAFITPRFEAAHACVLFSATLQPWHYYRDILGLPANAAWLDVDAPYDPEQLAVRITGSISSRYAHRQASLQPMADLIAAEYAAQPGNYLVFLSSHDYMGQLADTLQTRHPDITSWRQPRTADAAQREAFLARFEASGSGIGFAVLGGAFAEGIDLPGARLIGVFIATLGLPQVNAVNEQLRLHLAQRFGLGYEYAYLYPGLSKVIQAAGRVIRGPADRGVLYLMDDRYNRSAIRKLLPRWWRPTLLQGKTVFSAAPDAAPEPRVADTRATVRQDRPVRTR